MRTATISRDTHSTPLPPLRADHRYEQAEARVEALRQRLAVLEARREERNDPTEAWAQQLLRDPGAVLPSPPTPRDVTAEVAALRRALEEAERQLAQVATTVSHELEAQLRPAQVGRARQLEAALSTALEVIEAEIEYRAAMRRAGYSDPRRLAGSPTDHDALHRMRSGSARVDCWRSRDDRDRPAVVHAVLDARDGR